jgi:hypothetical protein
MTPGASHAQTGPSARGRLTASVAAAVFAVLLFHVVSIASGKVEDSGGRGWDGEGYARMATVALTDGGVTNQTRPLLPLLARIPYSLGLSVVDSFHLLNYLYAFVLFLTAGLILDLYAASTPVKCVVVANLGLCIATSKMFGFYPVQIDLGGMALTSVAFYLVRADRRWLAAGACVLATMSREFGAAAAIYGMHRSIRRGRPLYETLLVYLPGVATLFIIRWWVRSTVGEDSRGPFSVDDALGNLSLWLAPAFVAAFAYFTVTVFGGVSALLVVRARWSLGRIREEPELGTYLLLFIGLAAVGNWDIWRYLAYALPAALALIGQYFRGYDPNQVRRVLCAMTLVTLVTQRPFELMNTSLYFRDWFPLYRYFNGGNPDLTGVWSARLASLILLMTALSLTMRSNWRQRRLDA